MLADLPSVDDGNFTQTEAGQAADAALESMDTEEGSTLLSSLPRRSLIQGPVLHKPRHPHAGQERSDSCSYCTLCHACHTFECWGHTRGS